MKAMDILSAARALIADPARYDTADGWGTDVDGDRLRVGPGNTPAETFGLVGALAAASYAANVIDTGERIFDAMQDLIAGTDINSWCQSATHAQALRLIDATRNHFAQ